jgi:hypothetical protein
MNYIKNNVLFNFQLSSANSKTGNIIQIFILPLQWIIEGRVSNDDTAVCFDCKHGQSKEKSCYVRKGPSNLGLITKVKSLHKKLDDIPEFSTSTLENVVNFCSGKMIRFGAYGEPVLLGEDMVYLLTKASKGWVGYTHQWMRPEYKWASAYFMASTETILMDNLAHKLGFRTFLVTDGRTIENSVLCPASKEAGQKTICAKCLLCSGTSGKGKKSINIKKH